MQSRNAIQGIIQKASTQLEFDLNGFVKSHQPANTEVTEEIEHIISRLKVLHSKLGRYATIQKPTPALTGSYRFQEGDPERFT